MQKNQYTKEEMLQRAFIFLQNKSVEFMQKKITVAQLQDFQEKLRCRLTANDITLTEFFEFTKKQCLT